MLNIIALLRKIHGITNNLETSIIGMISFIKKNGDSNRAKNLITRPMIS